MTEKLETDTRVKAFTVLIRATQSIQKLIKQDFLDKDVKMNEYAILELLYHRGPQPIQSIGKRILLGTGSITYVIDKLVSRGYIRRRPCEKDRRKMYAELTDEGSAYMDSRVPEQEALIKEVFHSLSDEEVDTLIHLLKTSGYNAEDKLK